MRWQVAGSNTEEEAHLIIGIWLSLHIGGWRGERRVFLTASLGAGCACVPDEVPIFSPTTANCSAREDFLVLLKARTVRINFNHYFTYTSIKYLCVYFFLQF